MNYNINFDLYRLFYNVAQTGNLTKSAEQLYISQSAVTQSIQKLEKQLGGVLFIRSKQGVTLTNAGKTLYEYISKSIETIGNADDIFSKYQNLERGTINIAAGSTLSNIILKDVLKDFAKDYPNIKIYIQNMVTSQAIEKLATGSVDMVLLNIVGNINYDNIDITELKETEDVFFVNKDFYKELKIKNDEFNISNLSKYKLAFPAKGSNSRIYLDEKLLKNKIKVEPDYEFSSGSTLIHFVEDTSVIGYTNKIVISEKLKDKTLVELKLNVKNDKRCIGVATLNKKIANAATLKLLEYTKMANE